MRMPSIAKPVAIHPSLHRNELGLTIRDYEGTMSTLCAGCGHDSITAAIIRALWELSTAAAHARQAERHRLFFEDADLFRQRRARIQLRARPHARHRHRRQRRQSRTDLHRHFGRRRFALHRPRPHVPRHPPQCEHAVRHREQRRVRPDQGTVLRLGRRRLEEQARRAEPHGAHRSGGCSASASARLSSRAVFRATRNSWCRS